MTLLITGVGGGVISLFKVRFIGNRFSTYVQSQNVLRALRVSDDVQSQRMWMAFRVTTKVSISS